jgi:hypothetical protein
MEYLNAQMQKTWSNSLDSRMASGQRRPKSGVGTKVHVTIRQKEKTAEQQVKKFKK